MPTKPEFEDPIKACLDAIADLAKQSSKASTFTGSRDQAEAVSHLANAVETLFKSRNQASPG